MQSTGAPSTTKQASVPVEQSDEYMAIFPELVRELTEGIKEEIPDVAERLAWALEYNAPPGKRWRSRSVYTSYKMLEDPAKITPENIRLVMILGWCMEILQAYILIVDDVMDGSDLRRGNLCWYRKPEIGLTAVNDALMIEHCVYALLKKYFKDHPSYIPITELFHDQALRVTLGQSLDTACLDADGKPKLDRFTMKRYMGIIKYKTCPYLMHMPVAAALCFVGITDPEKHRQTEEILYELGKFVQIEDDFDDIYGGPIQTNKTCSDIEDGKCTWPAVTALERANPAQRKIMEEHFGRREPESVARIKELYEELSIPSIFAKYEDESYRSIKAQIEQIPPGLPKDIFFKIWTWVYQREA